MVEDWAVVEQGCSKDVIGGSDPSGAGLKKYSENCYRIFLSGTRLA